MLLELGLLVREARALEDRLRQRGLLLLAIGLVELLKDARLLLGPLLLLAMGLAHLVEDRLLLAGPLLVDRRRIGGRDRGATRRATHGAVADRNVRGRG